MKKSNLIKLLLVCLFPSFSSLIAQTEILVRFQDGTHPDTIENIRQEFNATELGISPLSSIRHWQLDSFIYINSEQFFLIGDDTLDIEDVGKKARVKTTIDSGGPNYETFLVSEKQQGDMAPGDITPCNTSLSCPASSQCEVIVSIIDSGVDTDHPYLSPLNWVSSYDFINNTHSQTDEHSHGTHVAGTIAQMVFNAGATNVSMMPLRTQDGTGSGHLFDLILAIDHSILRNANIINISLGYLGPRVDTITKPVPLEYAINLAGQHNVLVVTSAGNHGIDIDTQPYTSFPASFDCSNLITVGSTDCSKDIMSFSNFGDIHVDLGAPGLVYSTVLNEGWEFKVGTSMSSAIVTGLAAV
ncbi:MAG: S8 family serine peptidase, partial [Bacteroidota bacterium]